MAFGEVAGQSGAGEMSEDPVKYEPLIREFEDAKFPVEYTLDAKIGAKQIRIEALRAASSIAGQFVAGIMARADTAEAKDLLSDSNEMAVITMGLAKQFAAYLESGE